MSNILSVSFLGRGRLLRQGVYVHIFTFRYCSLSHHLLGVNVGMNPCRYAQNLGHLFQGLLACLKTTSRNDLAILNTLLYQSPIKVSQT